MHKDLFNLPAQADGDVLDQLQRAGMIDVGLHLNHGVVPDSIPWEVVNACGNALERTLQPSKGLYVRHVGGNPNNVSADQLIPAIASHVLTKNHYNTAALFIRMILRLGFAQNIKDGLNDSSHYKIPDFMLLRVLPLYSRSSFILYPVACLVDLYLVVMAIAAVLDRNPDSVDDNNLIITLAVCTESNATPFSWLARKIYGRYRAHNFGCDETSVREVEGQTLIHWRYNVHHPVYGALRWYHRAESGGNPEIAELWKTIVYRTFVD